jgi:hypothetical protein
VSLASSRISLMQLTFYAAERQLNFTFLIA